MKYKTVSTIAAILCGTVLSFIPASAQEGASVQKEIGPEAKAGTGSEAEARSLFEAGFAAYDKEQFEEAFSYFRQAADLGCAPAQYLLGECYYGGRGVKPDRNKAKELWKTALSPLRRSAEAGDAEALYLLGLYAENIYRPNSSGLHPPEEQYREFYRKAAELGYPRAEFKFAVCYGESELRTPPEKSPAEALKLYRKAAEAGYAQAQYVLGGLYEEGKGDVGQDLSEALNWYRKASDGGWARATYRIGVFYAEGKSVGQDRAEAVKWYRKAAEAGYPYAQFVYGRCLDTGNGVERDEAEAAKWYRKAAEQDLPAACSALAECYANGRGMEYDLKQASEWNIWGDQDYHGRVSAYNRRRIADRLDPAELDRFDNGLDAEMVYKANSWMEGRYGIRIAESYYYGRNGLRQNYAEAVKWYRNIVQKKSYAEGFGFCELGFCYEFGKGVEPDLEEAEKWYTHPDFRGAYYPWYIGFLQNRTRIREMIRQAQDGDTETAYRLGSMFADGINIKLDMPEALKWFRRAAEKDHPGAQYRIGRCYAEGDGVAKDPVEAVRWYRLAAEQGNANAQLALGNCHEEGLGVAKNPAEAVKWYRLAAEQGNANAQLALGKALLEGEEDEGKAFEARLWFLFAAEQGNAEAQYRIGKNHTPSYDSDRDEWLKWLTLAADQGYAPAFYALGYSGRGATGIEPVFVFDNDRMEEFYLAAAYQGYVPAMKELSAYYHDRDRDPGEAVKWLLRAQENGLELNTYQMYSIGQRYATGSGVKQNKAEAVKWYLKAAEDKKNAPDSRSLGALGDCYYAGDGVRQDKAQAAEWYRKASEKGGWKPKVMLTICYRDTRDERYEEQAEKAVKSLTAASGSNEDAQLALASCYERGIGVQENPSESFRRCSQLVENQGSHVSPLAYMRLARCYRFGIGVEKDRAKAEELFVKAAMKGSPEAQFMLGEFYEERKDDPVSCANALRWYQAAAEHGWYPAEYRLAQCYQRGLLGVKRDPYLAVDIQNEMGRHAPEPVRDPLRELGLSNPK